MKTLLQSVMTVIVFTVLTGFVYPLLTAGIAQTFMHDRAQGDADLIGQAFEKPDAFWSRPSATSAKPYDGAASSGSNLGPLSETLAANVQRRVEALHAAGDVGAPPIDLVTASGSGLDPHISPEAARYQAARVARLRGLTAEQIEALIAKHTEGRFAGIFGEPRVNVSILNQALDALGSKQ